MKQNISKNEVIEIIEILKSTYSDAKCSLDFETPFELVVAVILSAQCTDERVNKVTPALFENYKTPEDFVSIEINDLENYIHSCGFYKNKAKNIKLCAEEIVNKYNGIVPSDIDILESLPGIGRKSANVISLEVFGLAKGIAVDTHVKRISTKLKLSNKTEPKKIEQDLLKIIPQEYLKDVNHVFIYFGRDICKARNPKCDICPINKYCKSFKN